MYKHFFKRIIDVLASLLGIIILSPVYVGLAILIRVKLGGPALFKQRRPGYKNKIFTMYKFRTMTNKTDPYGCLLPDADRLTRFGSFLRKTSLDELPELFNILKGDMTLVGPRPQLIKDLIFMSDEVKQRHDIKPGLTGLAQVNGRNDILWEEKFEYDLEYLQKVTLFEDIKILVKTVFKVFKSEGVNTTGFHTAEDYGDYLLRVGKISESEYNSIMEGLDEI